MWESSSFGEGTPTGRWRRWEAFALCSSGGLNNYLPWEMPIWKQAVCGSALVTAVELVTGVVLNLYLGLGVWDYSKMPCNLLGQICLPYSALWVGLSLVCIFVDDGLRWRLFHEEKPHYRWI